MNRFYSSLVKPKNLKNLSYRVGEKLNGYIVKRIEKINELSLTAIELEHEKTNAKHLHLTRVDDNVNAFCVSFRTTPKNDTGVAHILEHLSLCGSKKYPCRDPFMKMISRSLATFLNACTGFDITYYPFATQNLKDYENLLGVYLDATFFPLLNSLDFLQEGWRLEPEKLLDDPFNSELQLKGVVLNEMKDIYANQMNIFEIRLIQNILPDTIYRNEFGGHPFNIPELNNDQIRQFHKKHYHPSNSKFYTYGNQPLDFYLSKIDQVLQKFDKNDDYKILSEIESQVRWTKGKLINDTYPPDLFNSDLSKQITTCKSFLLAEVVDLYENFVLSFLSTLLVEGQNSPFYESLINSGLGSDYSPDSGYAHFTKQSIFSIGLQGIQEKDIATVHEIIDKTLHESKENGFCQERINAILHSIELNSKHHTTLFGLNLIRSLNTIWNHDGDVIEALNINKNVERFKQDLKNNPNFLQEKIDQYLIKNSHHLTLSMKPNPNYSKDFKEKLMKIRDAKVAEMDDTQTKIIVENCLQLNKMINEKTDVEILPCLNVMTDIESKLPQPTQVDIIEFKNNKIQVAEQNTNQLIYFRALCKINLKELNNDLLPYLPIFCNLLTELSAGDFDSKQMAQQIELNTSGLNASIHVKNNLSTGDNCELYVLLYSYCLQEKLDKMLDLWMLLFNELKLDGDEQHIQKLIKMNAANSSQDVIYSGHIFAILRSLHSIHPIANLKEQLSGIEFIRKLNKISESENVAVVIENLKLISRIVFNKDNLSLAINAEPSQMKEKLKSCEKFLDNLRPNHETSNKQGTNFLNDFTPKNNLHEHYILPFNSNYVSKSHIGVPFTHPDYAKYQLLTKLLSRKYLHREIREKGSAYGSGLKMDSNGLLSFYSYRDPNLQNTLNVFEKSLEWVSDQSNYNDQDINEAKLDLFKEIDQPITAGNHGMNQFLYGINDRLLLDYRTSVFNIKKDDIANLMIDNFLRFSKKFGIACLGPENELTNSPNWIRLNDH